MSPSPGSDDGPGNPGPLPPALAAYTDYEVLRELGRGGMGVVYLARNRISGRLEALKLRSGPDPGDEFLHEVQAAAKLTHPNVAAVYSVRLVLGTLVLALEYVDGWDLARLVAARGPLPPGFACELARQAALGLRHAHEAGIVHRDVKPGNLILARGDGPPVLKVVDFGIALAAGTAGELSPGTPAFAAPEQLADPSRADARSDVYALGGTLFFLLTGTQPFAGGSGLELIRRHRHEPPPRADAVRPTVPASVADLVGRMLAKDPADRPQTAAEVAKALAAFANPDPPGWTGSAPETLTGWSGGSARTDEAPPSLAPTVLLEGRTSRRRWVAVGLAAIVLAAGLGGWWAFRDRHPPPDRTGTPDPPVPVPAVVPPPPAPVALFDGRSLAGWVVDGGDPGEWRVEGGALVTTGTPKGARSWLLSEREFGDFRVRFDYRLEPGGNSGFAFRAVPGECPVLTPGGKPTSHPYHQQIELSDHTAGRWPNLPTGQVNGGATSAGPSLKPRRPADPRPAGEWNRMEVEFRGQRVWVRVNGVEILADDLNRLAGMGSLYPALNRPRGRIGFQQQAKTAEFRDVVIEELGPAGGR